MHGSAKQQQASPCSTMLCILVKINMVSILKIINTDFWYKSNYLDFIDSTYPDVSGTPEVMINKLQAVEDAGERVWILGPVLK
jgi:hypothetical protein